MTEPIQRLDTTGAKVGGMTSDALSLRMKAKLGTFKPRDPVAGEAMPHVINTIARGKNIYKPAQHLGARVGLVIYG